MNDKIILLKLFLLTLFIGNVSMNLVEEGSVVVDASIPSYGWLAYGEAISYLNGRPDLKSFDLLGAEQSSFTPAQNMAKWALYHVNMNSAEKAINARSSGDRNFVEEYFNALVWLIGVADGRLKDWNRFARSWKNHRDQIPEGKSRVVGFHSNAAEHYKWHDKAQSEELDGEGIPEHAIATYWKHLLSYYYVPPSAGGSTSG